jgi:hypothetical protein
MNQRGRGTAQFLFQEAQRCGAILDEVAEGCVRRISVAMSRMAAPGDPASDSMGSVRATAARPAGTPRHANGRPGLSRTRAVGARALHIRHDPVFDGLQSLTRLGQAGRELFACFAGLLCGGTGSAFEQRLQITDQPAQIIQGSFRVAAHDGAPVGTSGRIWRSLRPDATNVPIYPPI